ncbi:MAG: hypothetical protein WBM00_00055 [Solirubrobacterales bacterium]
MADAMKLFQHEDFASIVAATAAAASLEESFVEKDYYITEILRIVAGRYRPGQVIFKALFTVTDIFIAVVNKGYIVKIEGPLEANALRILRQTPGVTAIAREPRERDRGVEAVLRFAGTRARVAVETKQRANAAAAWQLVQYTNAHPDTPVLLIAEETTAKAREILERHGIAVIDGLGNAHVELPGLLLHLEGRPRPKRTGATPARLSGKTGLVGQVLLLQHERAWHVQDLAKKAGVSAGLAHRVVARLEREGIMAAEGSGPQRVRRVTNPGALLDLWAEENVDRPARTLGYLLAQTPQRLITKLGTNLGGGGIDYAVTGAAAASLVAPFVTAVPIVEVWVSARTAPDELLQRAEAEPVTNGENVVFLQAKDDAPLAFREKEKGVWLANPFRLYVDLLRDPRRGREQAEHLRQEAIGF